MDYYPISEEQIKSAKSFWEPRYGRDLSDEEAREIIRNTESFIEVLLEAAKMEGRSERATTTASTADDSLEPIPDTMMP